MPESTFGLFLDELFRPRRLLFLLIALGAASVAAFSGLQLSHGWKTLGAIMSIVPPLVGVILYFLEKWGNRTRDRRQNQVEDHQMDNASYRRDSWPSSTRVRRLSQIPSINALDISPDVFRTETRAVASKGTSSLWKGEYTRNGTTEIVAIKLLNKGEGRLNDEERQVIQREVYDWAHLQHHNIARVFGFINSPDFLDTIGVISPWYDNGNLLQYLVHRPNEDRLSKMRMLAHGLKYLHENDIVHGDVRCVNVMVKQDGTALLNDYGLEMIEDTLGQRVMADESTYSTSICWSSPELITTNKWSKQADVYAFASTCLEIVQLRRPYHNWRQLQIYTHVVLEKRFPERPSSAEGNWEPQDNLWEFLETLWAYEPGKRPVMGAVERFFDRLP